MANNSMWDGYHRKSGKLVSTNRTDILPAARESTAFPTMSAGEVQNVVAQNTAAPAPAAVQSGIGNKEAAANAATAPLSVSGMGLAGGREAIIPGTGAYNNVFSNAMERTMNDLLNPTPFSYDVNADGLYQQIKDNYVKQGKQAMMDTQGQSAALTGGYGNSYGAQAGQQAYQDSLGNLAGMIPELRQLAYQQYLQEQDDKRNNLEAMNKLEAQDYSRWMDEQQMKLELYKNFPELMTMLMNPTSNKVDLSGLNIMLPDIGSIMRTMTGKNGNGDVVDMNTYSTYVDYFKENPQAAYDALTHINTGGSFSYGKNSDIEKAAMYVVNNGDWNANKMAVPVSRTIGGASAVTPTTPTTTSGAGSKGNTNSGSKEYNSERTNKWVFSK